MQEKRDQSDDDLSIHTVSDDAAYREYSASSRDGICLVAEPYGNTSLGLKADGADFAKWLKQERPELPISLPISSPKISLHGADIWLPLIYLASDVAMPIFLNLVSSYLFDKFRGNLEQDRPKVHFSVIYQSKNDEVTKRLEFSGDNEALKELIRRFDMNNFFDESAK
ncbi:hypothetical protein P3W70_19055 [Achromobacter denitrificans]|uniref:hypothetical protein n=1 Tax=Achromobacter denitrificans TaxID=32002 RepID=UPI0023E87E2A|nr:hypothetical protein [Achromobacter denitrificans]MDF3860460.1 hypothetical protein [Achromobacter denitrificans]